MRYYILLTLFATTFHAIYSQQNLPESAVYSSATGHYYFTNTGNGKILKLSPSMTIEDFATGLDQPRGICLHNDTFYVATENTLSVVSPEDGSIIQQIVLPGAMLANDVCCDNNGNIFVSGMLSNKIFRVSLSDYQAFIFVSGGITRPNGLAFDEENNSLLCVSFTENSPVYNISLNDSLIQTSYSNAGNYLDGITNDQYGNWLITAWETSDGSGSSGKLFSYTKDFSVVDTLFDNLEGPADIYFNASLNELFLPEFQGNSFTIIDMCSVETSEISGNTNVLVGETYTYSVDNTIGSSYNWSVSGGNIIGGENTSSIIINWTTSGAGMINVKETDQYGCIGEASDLEIIIGTSSVKEENNPNFFEIYPNPAKEIVNISYFLTMAEEIKIELLSKEGKLLSLLNSDKSSAGENIIRFNSTEYNLANGVYFVRFTGINQSIVRKLVIIE